MKRGWGGMSWRHCRHCRREIWREKGAKHWQVLPSGMYGSGMVTALWWVVPTVGSADPVGSLLSTGVITLGTSESNHRP
eukprot:scaffold7358_cov252-Pinguiococcus_pyrenoidosus.AAC.16